jgi:hypothetical protein
VQDVPSSRLGISSPQETSPDVQQLEHGAWLIRNVLSKAECACIRASASQHMEKEPLDTQRHRDLKRCVFMCPEAADIVYSRVRSFPLLKDDVEVCRTRTC